MKVTEENARLYHQRTGEVLRCCWLSCRAFSICDHHQWGEQRGDREVVGDLLSDMLPDLVNMSGPWNPDERGFLEDMLDRFENDDRFIPTDRQTRWMESLHSRWSSKRHG